MSTVRSGNQPALVVVDVQVGVMADAWDASRVVDNVACTVERARAQGVPVIWVQHESDELPRDSGPWQLMPQLRPREGEARVHKKFESSFEQTKLDDELARIGATHIVLAGAQTNWCIRATAYGALDRGYDLTLVKDAHTTCDIDFADGSKVEATSIVKDLNVAMTWVSYPGRKSATASAAEIDFARLRGAAVMTRPLHIGIVACSAEGASLCYRTICEEGAQLLGPHAHPEVSLHTHSLADYVKCLDAGDLRGVGELMLSSANKLARAGAVFLVCPDNTIHQALDHVLPRSPLPWLHIAGIVAQEARARGFRKLALTGTRWLVDSDVYPAKLSAAGLECVKPDPDARAQMHHFIMDELVYGRFTPQAVRFFQSTIEGLKAQGCDAVILGCTEIPLIIGDDNSVLPTLDSTRLLARAALRKAVG
jgi:aspartate racemase